MRNINIVIFFLLIISCGKEEVKEDTDTNTNEPIKDSCNFKRLMGLYVGIEDPRDTVLIDSIIYTYIDGMKVHDIEYIDAFRFCAYKDSVRLKRIGRTKPNLPDVTLNYKITNSRLKFEKIDSIYFVFDFRSFFQNIDNKEFEKVK